MVSRRVCSFLIAFLLSSQCLLAKSLLQIVEGLEWQSNHRGISSVVSPLRRLIERTGDVKKAPPILTQLINRVSVHLEKEKKYKDSAWFHEKASLYARSYLAYARRGRRLHKTADLYLKANDFTSFSRVLKRGLKELVGHGSPVDGDYIYDRLISESRKRKLKAKMISFIEERFRFRKSLRPKVDQDWRAFDAEQSAEMVIEYLALGEVVKASRHMRSLEKATELLKPAVFSYKEFNSAYTAAGLYYERIGRKEAKELATYRHAETKVHNPSFELVKINQESTARLRLPSYHSIFSYAYSNNHLYIYGPYENRKTPAYRDEKAALYAFNLHQGKLSWHFVFDRVNMPIGRVVAKGRYVAFSNERYVCVFDGKSGHKLWSRDLYSNYGTVFLTETLLIVASRRQNWRPGRELLKAYSVEKGDFRWHRKMDGLVLFPPATDGKNLYVSVANNEVIALDLLTCKPLWRSSVLATSAPVVTKENVFVMGCQYVNQSTKLEVPTRLNKKSGAILDCGHINAAPIPFLQCRKHMAALKDSAKGIYIEEFKKCLSLLNQTYMLLRPLRTNDKAKYLLRALSTLISDYEKTAKTAWFNVLQGRSRGRLRFYGKHHPLEFANKHATNLSCRLTDLIQLFNAIARLVPKARTKELQKKLKALRNYDLVLKTVRREMHLLPYEKTYFGFSLNRWNLSPNIRKELFVKSKTNYLVLTYPPVLCNTSSPFHLIRLPLTRPATMGSDLIITSGNTVKRLGKNTRRVRWIVRLKTQRKAIRPISQPIVHKNRVYITTADGSFLAYDGLTARQLLKKELKEPISHPPLLYDSGGKTNALVITDLGTIFHFPVYGL